MRWLFPVFIILNTQSLPANAEWVCVTEAVAGFKLDADEGWQETSLTSDRRYLLRRWQETDESRGGDIIPSRYVLVEVGDDTILAYLDAQRSNFSNYWESRGGFVNFIMNPQKNTFVLSSYLDYLGDPLNGERTPFTEIGSCFSTESS